MCQHSALSTQHSVITRLIRYCKKLALLPFLLVTCASTAQTTTFYYFDLTTPLNGYDMAISTDRQTTCNKAIVAFDATHGVTSNLPPTKATVGEYIDGSTGLGWGAYYCAFEYSTTDPAYPRVTGRRDIQKRTCPDGQKLVQKFTTVADYGYFSIYLVCEKIQPTLLGFFNGVLNSPKDATASLDRLEAEFPSTAERPLIYGRFLNQSGCPDEDVVGGKIDCLQDFIELYDQLEDRVEKRFDDWGAVVFSEILNGSYKNPGSVTQKLILERKRESVRLALGQFADLIADKLQISPWMKRLLKLVAIPPTVTDTAGHIATLKSYADKVKGMVFVAHSQGNFFANAAYAGMQGNTPPVKIEVVHIAPPTSELNGGYILTDTDSVIHTGLRALGASLRPSNFHLQKLSVDPTCFDIPVSPETPPCADYAYMSVPQGDWPGHGFLETYLNKAYNAYAAVVAMIDAAIDRVRS